MIPLLFIKSKRGDFKNIEIGRRVQIVAMIGCVLVASNLWYLIGVKKTSRALGTSFYRAGFGKHPRFSDSVPEYALEKYPGKNGYNHYNYGTYLIWKWWPDKRVFVDSKSSAYKPEFMKKYKNTYDFNLIEEYELDHAITSYRQQLPYTHLIPHPEWEIKAMDEGFILFEKVDQAVSKKPSEYLLLSSKELNRLQPREKKQLKEVMEFIKSNQNDEDKVGRYFSINSWESAKNK